MQTKYNRLGHFLDSVRNDCAPVFQNFLQYTLKKIDLVSRDELDAQTRVLARSQQKLRELEAKLQILQQTDDSRIR